MPFAASNDIELYYETHGNENDPPLLLVNGFSSQIIGWHDGYRETLAERGRFVISFDNRDVGLSTLLDGQEANLEARHGSPWGRRTAAARSLHFDNHGG